jgi:hypothetical protein
MNFLEDQISNKRDANFYAHLLIVTFYMFQASLAHHQELRKCLCSVWYCHVDLCSDRQYNFVYGAMVNVVQYNVDVYWLWVTRSLSLG